MGSNKRPGKPDGADDAAKTTVLPRGVVEGAEDKADNQATQAWTRGAGETMAVTPSMVLPLGAGEARSTATGTMELTPDMMLGDASLVMGPAVIEAAIRVVEQWHVAVNAKDAEALVTTCAEDIEIAGPRGAGRGHAVIRDWLGRAGFAARPLRWFCGGDGHVVVEQQARWRERDGELTGVIASAFVVRGGRIRRYERFEELATALTMYGLRPTHEVAPRL